MNAQVKMPYEPLTWGKSTEGNYEGKNHDYLISRAGKGCWRLWLLHKTDIGTASEDKGVYPTLKMAKHEAQVCAGPDTFTGVK